MYKIDFSGLNQFWFIHDILCSDKDPNHNDWEKLFSTPGYKVLTESEFSIDLLVKLFSIALKPSLRSETAYIKSNYKLNMINHYRNVSASRKELVEYANEVKNGNFISDSLNLCIEYLPTDSLESPPPISYLIFDNDARGYSPVVIDLLASKNYENNILYLIAHEAHHYYRNKHADYDYDSVPKEYKDLIRVLNQIQLEGIADCIDKANKIKLNRKAMKYYIDLVNDAPRFMELLDKTIVNLCNNELSPLNAGELLNSKLPMSGHPIGFYMSQIIIASGNKESMINSCYNCFDFFDLYNKSAKTDDYIFSTSFINSLRKIEKTVFNS